MLTFVLHKNIVNSSVCYRAQRGAMAACNGAPMSFLCKCSVLACWWCYSFIFQAIFSVFHSLPLILLIFSSLNIAKYNDKRLKLKSSLINSWMSVVMVNLLYLIPFQRLLGLTICPIIFTSFKFINFYRACQVCIMQINLLSTRCRLVKSISRFLWHIQYTGNSDAGTRS